MSVMLKAVEVAIENAETLEQNFDLILDLSRALDRACVAASRRCGDAPNMRDTIERLELIVLANQTSHHHAARL